MAQNNDKTIILQRRSAISGSRPTTSTLKLGEIGLNTYDGTAFLQKSGSVNTIEQIVVANSTTVGSINITQTGSFGELSVTNDINVSGDAYISGDIVGNGSIDILGSVTASVVSASFFVGDGSGLRNVVISDANNYDFNITPAAGMAGYFSGSVFGIGDVLAFSGSVADQIASLHVSASLLDAGQF